MEEEGHRKSISVDVYPASSPIHYVDPVKRACLPRFARDQDLQNAQPISSRSLADRLNQMRVEDARRERNKRQCPQRAPPPVPSTFDATSSASSRAGTLFYRSNELAQREMDQRQMEQDFKRQFSGPTPPTSWRNTSAASKETRIGHLGESQQIDIETKRRSTLAMRYFLDGGEKDLRLASLTDACLSCIAQHLCKSEHLAERKEYAYLPIHLKDRMMALAGRKQMCEPMNGTALQFLLLQDEQGRQNKSSEHRLEAWDSTEEEKAFDSTSLKNLDLSFARIGHQTLRNILSQGAQMHQLCNLSLAGYGSEDSMGEKSLVTILNLMETIGNLPHLEFISLAKTRLYPTGKGNSHKTKDGVMLESITFLKRLSRSSLRLKVLDLSECDWIVGPDIANLGWYSIDKIAKRSSIIWPRLQHLVLTNCRPFHEMNKFVDELQPSPAYVARWHAAHHGVALVTDSPYLLQHRPGLGNAVFHAEDAQQARQARQRRSMRQAARNNVWGSPDQSEEEEEERGGGGGEQSAATVRRSSSSSAYPTRCPVSGVQVGAWEWERARVLDAVRGRWGNAIKGNISLDKSHQGGPFIEVYF